LGGRSFWNSSSETFNPGIVCGEDGSRAQGQVFADSGQDGGLPPAWRESGHGRAVTWTKMKRFSKGGRVLRSKSDGETVTNAHRWRGH